MFDNLWQNFLQIIVILCNIYWKLYRNPHWRRWTKIIDMARVCTPVGITSTPAGPGHNTINEAHSYHTYKKRQQWWIYLVTLGNCVQWVILSSVICDLGMLIVLTACSLDQDHLAEEQDRMLEEPRQPRPAHTKAGRWSFDQGPRLVLRTRARRRLGGHRGQLLRSVHSSEMRRKVKSE